MNEKRIDPVESFDSFYQVFKQAEEFTGESQQHFFNIAGFEIELRFANSALVRQITPGLAHLKSQPKDSPALTVCIWDSVSTGEQMPAPPWSQQQFNARGEVRGFYNEHIFLSFQPDRNILNMLDTNRNLGLFWIRDSNDFPPNLRAVPLRPIFHWWMRENGLLFVHAAAAGIKDSGVLIVGKGGSGKSSSALACLTSGMLYLGDDHVLIKTDPEPSIFSLYSAARMDELLLDTLKVKSKLFDNTRVKKEDKALIFLNQLVPSQLVPGLPMQAVIVPSVTDKPETSITPVSSMAAVRALAPSTIFMLSGAGKKELSEMVKIVQHVSCFSLQIGNNLWDVPELILQILS